MFLVFILSLPLDLSHRIYVISFVRGMAWVYGRECGKEELSESRWMQVWRWLPMQKQELTKVSVSNAPAGAPPRLRPTR